MYKREALEKQKNEEKERKAQEATRKKQAAEKAAAAAAAATEQQNKIELPQISQETTTWTNEQQKEMEKGMKEVSTSLSTKDRWIQIAEGVNGKTAKECFQRYKELCSKAK